MSTNLIHRDMPDAGEASLPTTFIGPAAATELTEMLELAFEQAQQISGGLAKAVRCCACHCCSCHC